jgi:phosphoserine phosphatase
LPVVDWKTPLICRYLGSSPPPSEFSILRQTTLAGYAAAIMDLPTPEDKARLLGQLRRQRPDENWGVVDESFRCTALFFDMDATAIAQESLVEMARLVGREQEVAKITERAMRGELDFAQALRARLQLIAGESTDIYERVWPKLKINSGLSDLVDAAFGQRIPSFLISGGFVPLATKLAGEVKFADFHANRLTEKDGRLTGEVDGEVVDAGAKRRWLIRQCQERRIDRRGAVAVGDGANDLMMMDAAGLSVGYQAKPIVQGAVDVHVADGKYAFVQELLFGNFSRSTPAK